MQLFLCLFTAFFSTLLTRWLIQHFSQHLLDIPNDRSSHTQPTPRGGGLGFLTAFLLTGVVDSGLARLFPETISPLHPSAVLVSLVLVPLAIVGFIDDRQSVPAAIRYLVQLTAAGLTLVSFGPFLQPWLPETLPATLLATVLMVIGFTAVINFYNFMDGLDGLVASVTAAQLAFLAGYLHQPLWWLLAAALLGFLRWNWPPARIFMGDVGSTTLGASIGIALLLPATDPSLNLAALAITLPLTADTIYTLTRRLLRGENIFQAHRTHLYQRLQQSGWTHARVTIAYLAWTGAIAALLGRFHLVGSVISLLLSGLLIGVGEIYLQRQQLPSGIN
jgi:UDP-N-acetylmuramyl pentapeptide phosphotransferase/UDP-N-acetylglucosamine-1-phosphate transferase